MTVKSFSPDVGYLMSYKISDSCVSHTYTPSAASPITSSIISFGVTASVRGTHDSMTGSSAAFAANTDGGN